MVTAYNHKYLIGNDATVIYQSALFMNKGVTFLKKLWCCVGGSIESFTVADVILVVGQTRQNLQ